MLLLERDDVDCDFYRRNSLKEFEKNSRADSMIHFCEGVKGCVTEMTRLGPFP